MENAKVIPISPAFQITVDDGSVKVPVRNKHGDEIGVFYFSPTDTGIYDRYNEIIGKIDEIIAPLEHVNISPDGTAEEGDRAGIEAMHEATKRLYEAIDYLFGGNMSEAFFGKVHPFSPVNGAFYFENALDSVGQFIASQHDREVAKINKRLTKYTQGYSGGKNRKRR